MWKQDAEYDNEGKFCVFYTKIASYGRQQKQRRITHTTVANIEEQKDNIGGGKIKESEYCCFLKPSHPVCATDQDLNFKKLGRFVNQDIFKN